jgi:hypothetical protein
MYEIGKFEPSKRLYFATALSQEKSSMIFLHGTFARFQHVFFSPRHFRKLPTRVNIKKHEGAKQKITKIVVRMFGK